MRRLEKELKNIFLKLRNHKLPIDEAAVKFAIATGLEHVFSEVQDNAISDIEAFEEVMEKLCGAFTIKRIQKIEKLNDD